VGARLPRHHTGSENGLNSKSHAYENTRQLLALASLAWAKESCEAGD
jgi:hypothetical protein